MMGNSMQRDKHNTTVFDKTQAW